LYGSLLAASGGGALCASFYLATRRTVVGLGRLIGIATIVFAASLAAFAMSSTLWISFLLVPLAGWGTISIFASCNTLLQTLADEDKRGRVMSFFAMAFVGMAPFGNLVAGQMASWLTPPGSDPVVGASHTLVFEACACALAAIVYWRMLPAVRNVIRPIYIKKGILPAIAEGLAASTAVTRED
jgi:MFS family permease